MILVIGIMLVLGLFTVIGGIYLKVGKARSYDRLSRDAEFEIQNRLESIAASVGGNIVAGPALETLAGRMTLLASQAPRSMVIDLAKYTAPLKTTQQLTIAPLADSRKIIQTKNLRPVKIEEPEIAKDYLVLSSDEAFARAVVTADLLEAIQALDREVKVRSRLQVAGGKGTILATRGLARPEELKAFHDRSAAVIGSVRLPESG